jgi:Leucine-rich repeat (LRR) protein
VEYAVDANPLELTLLFAAKDVKKAFQQDVYKNDRTGFEKTLEQQLLSRKKVENLKFFYQSAKDLQPEIDRFKELYENFTLQASSPVQIKKYNELNQFMTKMLEESERKSFDFQVEQYLQRLKEDFQKDFLEKNHYIDLNAETRIEKKAREIFQKIAKTDHIEKLKEKEREKAEEQYESIVHKPLDTFINQWLADDSQNLLVILGEYGTGKTTFLRHMAHQVASNKIKPGSEKAIVDEKNRIPLFLPLRYFEKNIEPFIINQFSKEGISDIDFARFKQRIANEEFVILLDGFDEMTQKIDADEKSKNFDKIRQLIESSKKSKIILTARQEYFQSAADIQEVFKHTDKKNYQFIHLLPFDDDQIQQYLKTHTDNPGYYWEQIQEIFDLHDLAKRPVLLQLIVDYLPDLIKEKGENETINASDLYNKCIRDELRRKNELDFIIPNKYRLEILQKLAVWMFLNDTLNFDTGLLERELNLRQYFKTDRAWEFEKYLNEFLTFTFLIREADNQYRISHKSFRDYLTAQAFVKEINSGKIQYFARNRTTKEITHYILEQKPAKEALLDLVLNARDLPEERQWQGTNAANILLKIDDTILKDRDLSRCQLTFINFWRCSLTGTNFHNANLNNCSFSQAVLSAHFHNTNVENSDLYLFDSGITDITFLKEFKGFSQLNLSHNKIVDISILKDSKNLTHLELQENQITNISPIRDLKNLTQLDLSSNQITDISPIRQLKNLTQLNLSSNPITDISPIWELKNLTDLTLHNNQITNISPIRQLKNLTQLDLSSNQITDISPIRQLKNLTNVNLWNNQITDFSVLKELENLRELILETNRMDEKQKAGLKEVLPNLKLDDPWSKLRQWKETESDIPSGEL